MNVDPSGCFTLLGLGISFAVSVIFEILEDAIDGEVFTDDSHDPLDYFGAGISGIFGGFTYGKNPASQFAFDMIFSIAGGMIDAAISGDLKEKGFWNTMGSIAVSSVCSYFIGNATKEITASLKASSLKKLSNNVANGKLRDMGTTINIGSNKAKAKGGLAKEISNIRNWVGNIASEKIAASISSGTISSVWDSIFNK